MKQKIIIDTDPGVDDAIALMYALSCEELEVDLICSAGGNSPIENITQNALHLLDILDKDVPVAKGAAKPLNREPEYAPSAQGKMGLGKYKYNRNKITRK